MGTAGGIGGAVRQRARRLALFGALLAASGPALAQQTGPRPDRSPPGPNSAVGRPVHEPAPGRATDPDSARRHQPDRNTAAGRPTHAPRPALPPLLVWQLLERNNRAHAEARRRAARAQADGHASGDGHGPGPAAPPTRPAGAGRYVVAVVTCADADVDPGALFGLERRDVLELRVPGPFVGPEDAALLERAVRRHRLSLIVVLGHDGCDALQPSDGDAPDALDRRVAALRARGDGAPLAVALVRRQRELLLAASDHLAALVRDDGLRVVPALVDEPSGRVRWQHRRMAALPLAPVR